MRHHQFKALSPEGFHRVSYTEWGAVENNRVLLCMHGVCRNNRDFDDLAHILCRDYRVVCPDMVGRGASDWLAQPQHYCMRQYLSDMSALIARLGVDQVHCLGTSMGGLIGMSLAAMPHSPIASLVLNDIGSFISQAALQRIDAYLSDSPRFESLEEVEAYLRRLYPAYAGISDQQWRRLAKTSSREADGGWCLHYDPAICETFHEGSRADVDLWSVWRQVRCPQLLLWGTASDVLTRDIVAQMQAENPGLVVQEFVGVGHPPSLMVPEQIRPVMEWLRSQRCGAGW